MRIKLQGASSNLRQFPVVGERRSGGPICRGGIISQRHNTTDLHASNRIHPLYMKLAYRLPPVAQASTLALPLPQSLRSSADTCAPHILFCISTE